MDRLIYYLQQHTTRFVTATDGVDLYARQVRLIPGQQEYQVAAAAATINPCVCVCCASAATDDRMSELQIAIVAQFRK